MQETGTGAIHPGEGAPQQRGRPRSLASQKISSSLVKGLLLLCVLFSLMTTVTIIAVLLKETYAFFMMDEVSLHILVSHLILGHISAEFLTQTHAPHHL